MSELQRTHTFLWIAIYGLFLKTCILDGNHASRNDVYGLELDIERLERAHQRLEHEIRLLESRACR